MENLKDLVDMATAIEGASKCDSGSAIIAAAILFDGYIKIEPRVAPDHDAPSLHPQAAAMQRAAEPGSQPDPESSAPATTPPKLENSGGPPAVR